MKTVVLTLLFLGFIALVVSQPMEYTKRTIPIPRENCPQRNFPGFALVDEELAEIEEAAFDEFFNYFWYYYNYDLYAYENMYAAEGRDLPFDNYYGSDYEYVDMTDSDLMTYYITELAYYNNDPDNVKYYGGNLTLYIFRKNRLFAQNYADAAMSASTLGLRIVTFDFEASKAEAIATLTASEPRERNALAFATGWEAMKNLPMEFQLLRDDIGRKCVVSDRMTIHTFDGAAYTHTDIGDYVIYRQHPEWLHEDDYWYGDRYYLHMPGMEVQVRKTQCENTTRKQACISSIAFSHSQESEEYPYPQEIIIFQYDRVNNDILINYNGYNYPAEMFAWDYEDIYINRIEPNVGLKIRVNYNYFRTYWSWVSSMAPVIEMNFFQDETRDPIIIIQGGIYAWDHSTGLCGTFDSCFENEIITSTNDIADFVNISSPTWKVHGGESLFERLQYTPIDEEDAEYYDYQFITNRAPFIPNGWTSDDGEAEMLEGQGENELNDDVLFLLCSDYCNYHSSGLAAIDQHPEVCDGLCDDQASDLAGLRHFNIHTEYNNTNLPYVYMGSLNDGKNANLMAPMGGIYVFEVRTQDCCTEADNATNVTITVSCSNTLAIEIENGDYAYLPLQPFPTPGLRLTAKLTAEDTSNVHVSWKILDQPDFSWYFDDYYDTEGYEVAFRPKIVYPNSLTAFYQMEFPGNYTLEVVAFDGCTRAYDRINITVGCANTTYSTYHTGGSSAWYGGFSRSVLRYYLPCSETFAIPHSEIDYWWGIDYTFANVEISLPNPISSALQMEHNYDTDYENEWQTFWEAESVINTTTTITQVNYTIPDEYIDYHDIYPENGIRRIEGLTSELFHMIEAKEVTKETIQVKHVIHSPQCSIQAYNYSYKDGVGVPLRPYPFQNTFTLDSLPEYANTSAIRAIVSRSSPFRFGVCEGLYHIDVNVSNKFYGCAASHDEEDWHVTCQDEWQGPYSKPFSPCFPVYYNYYSHEFNWVYFEFENSNDRLGRSLNYYLTEKEWPATSDGGWVYYPYSYSYNYLLPDVEGNYTFELAVSNGCGVDTETYQVEALCDGDVTAVLYCPASPVVFNYSFAYLNYFYINGTLTHTTAQDNYYGGEADLWYEWTKVFPDGYNYSWSDGNALNHNFYAGGTYKYIVRAQDGCREDTAECTITVTCPNNLVAKSAINTTTVMWNPILGYSDTADLFDFTESTESYWPYWDYYYQLSNGTYEYYDYIYGSNVSFRFSDTPYGPQSIKFELYVEDSCQYDIVDTPLYLNLVCSTNELNPYIQLTNPGRSELYYENNTFFEFDSDQSTAGMWDGVDVPFESYWTVVYPDGYVEDLYGMYQSFFGDQIGEYNLTLAITDGCNWKQVTMNLHVYCAQELKAKASISATSVQWNGKKFPVVTVFGSSSDLGEAQRDDVIEYTWYFLDTPTESVFRGAENVEIQTNVDVQIYNDTDWVITGEVGSDQTYTKAYREITTTYTWSYTAKSKLKNSIDTTTADTAYEPFGACFRPDVPGKYKLQLEMKTDCSTSTDEITVNAVCNNPPVLGVVVPTEAKVNEQILLDASTTTDSDDEISFVWAAVDCSDESYDLTEMILNRYSSKAIISPDYYVDLCVSLVVSDGCTELTQDFIINVTCNKENLTTPFEDSYETEFDGLGSHLVRVSVTDEVEHNQEWLDSHLYLWKLVGFTPIDEYKDSGLTGGQIAGIVIGSILLAALIAAAAILGVWLYKRHPKSASSTTEATVHPPPATGAAAAGTEKESPEVEMTPTAV